DSLHIKDGNKTGGNGTQTAVGAGSLPFDPVLAAARGKVRWYHLEIDPPGNIGAGKWVEVKNRGTEDLEVTGVSTRGAAYDSAGDFLVGEETCTAAPI